MRLLKVGSRSQDVFLGMIPGSGISHVGVRVQADRTEGGVEMGEEPRSGVGVFVDLKWEDGEESGRDQC